MYNMQSGTNLIHKTKHGKIITHLNNSPSSLKSYFSAYKRSSTLFLGETGYIFYMGLLVEFTLKTSRQ
jgi:hypothetical protein